jgi:hypothetical protein
MLQRRSLRQRHPYVETKLIKFLFDPGAFVMAISTEILDEFKASLNAHSKAGLPV